MGFASVVCAASGQSIPVPAVNPTRVVAFMPDGKKVHGIYDGYGSIEQDHGDDYPYIQSLFKNPYINDFKIALENIEDDVRHGGAIGSPPSRVVRFDAVGSYVDHNGVSVTVSEKMEFQINDFVIKAEDYAKTRLGTAESSIKMDIAENLTKVVKEAFYNPKMTFDNLPVSPFCRHQGYFYPEGYDYNAPCPDVNITPWEPPKEASPSKSMGM